MWFLNKVLLNRIKDLERQVELLTGANVVLTHQLERSQQKEEEILEKIFNITGVNKITSNSVVTPVRQPIAVGNRKIPWNKLRDNLELKAREEYWDKKKVEQDNKKNNIEILENDVLGGTK